jgi:predicted GNAT family N-acyltransferase
LRSNLAQLDLAGQAAYLEASDELVAFYQRFGFAQTGRFELAGGPTVNSMWREPGTSARC